MIRTPALQATNILAKDEGHLSILLSPFVVSSMVEQLLAVEEAGTSPTTELTASHLDEARRSHPSSASETA
jgi:hypothetical protein